METAGDDGSVGVVDGDRPLAEIVFSARLSHGEKLLPALDAALKLAELTPREIELIAVSQGPGSFTGLRIGIATAKGLARALDAPLVGIPTLEAYAHKAPFWEGLAVVLWPDRRDSVYFAGFQGDERVWPTEVGKLEELLQRLIEGGREDLFLVGPGAERHRERLREALPRASVASAALNGPSGVEVARLGLERYRAHGRDELFELEPLYFQPPLAGPKPMPAMKA